MSTLDDMDNNDMFDSMDEVDNLPDDVIDKIFEDANRNARVAIERKSGRRYRDKVARTIELRENDRGTVLRLLDKFEVERTDNGGRHARFMLWKYIYDNYPETRAYMDNLADDRNSTWSVDVGNVMHPMLVETIRVPVEE